MKRIVLVLAGCLLGFILMMGSALAFDFPQGPIEIDLDNRARLYYDDGTLVPIGTPPAVGMVSKTFLNFNDISPTLGYGGTDLPPVWIAGTNGEYLYGVVKNIEISHVSTDQSRFYFNREPGAIGYEFELYVSNIDLTTFFTDANYLAAGPANFDAIYNNLVANSTLLIAGNFAQSTFTDTDLGTILADAGVEVPLSFLGGAYINQDTIPFFLGVNAFVDVDLSVGLGDYVIQGLYGSGPDGSQYDIAIQNIRLNSESDPYGWIISDDGTRLGIRPPEEPGDCRVTAGGNKDGYNIPCALKSNGMPDKNCVKDISHTWGGQAGAPPRIDGNWTHHYKASKKDNFGFHSNDLFCIECSDPGPHCDPARFAPNRQIDFSGIGRFTHKKGGYAALPDGPLCFQVHLEDIGEPGRGGKWPISVAEGLDCEHCPGTPIVNGDPDDLFSQSDCRDCTDYYEIKIYGSAEHDDCGCTGEVIWMNGSPDTGRCGSGDPQLEGFFTRAGNVQMHPDNN